MFVTNWISPTKIQKISEITNFFRHYFLSRTEVGNTYFKVKCKLQQKFLVMKKTGLKGYLKKGMVANVRFMITKRSLFDILYQNIDEWINPTQYITE